jgi:hypothetical protein
MTTPYALMDAYIEGLLKDDQFDELNDWLHADPEHARLFAVWTQTHCQIHEYLLSEDMRPVIADDVSDLEQNHEGFDDDQENYVSSVSPLDASGEWERLLPNHEAIKESGNDRKSSVEAMSTRELFSLAGFALRLALTSTPAYKAYAAAAVILLAVTLFFIFGGEKDSAPSSFVGQGVDTVAQNDPPVVLPTAIVATLTNEQDAAWERRPGQDLYAGQRFTLTQGFAEITTSRGAIAILEAPTTIELIDSPNALHLHAGKLVGICETESSKGFLVRTKHADITDLGTEFGVEVKGERVGVSVFAGEVRIDAPDIAPKHLTASQAADVVFDGQTRQLVEHESADLAAKFIRRLPRSEVATAARITGVEGLTPQIIASGFFENAKPFTDRNYVLTGIDGKGLPVELIGGDLVQMPAQARFLETEQAKQMRLELDLAAASDVYLLLEHQLPPPAWLQRDYEKTPWQVGVFFDAQRTDQYSIWKYSKTTIGRAVVAEGINKSIYSIVVVPSNKTEDPQP